MRPHRHWQHANKSRRCQARESPGARLIEGQRPLELVREAGGVITDRDGGPVSVRSEGVIAGAPGAHADLLRLAAGRAWR